MFSHEVRLLRKRHQKVPLRLRLLLLRQPQVRHPLALLASPQMPPIDDEETSQVSEKTSLYYWGFLMNEYLFASSSSTRYFFGWNY